MKDLLHAGSVKTFKKVMQCGSVFYYNVKDVGTCKLQDPNYVPWDTKECCGKVCELLYFLSVKEATNNYRSTSSYNCTWFSFPTSSKQL